MTAANTTATEITCRRSALRMAAAPDEPLYLQIGKDSDARFCIVELGGAGVRVLCHTMELFDCFSEGQALQDSLLILGQDGRYPVHPTVRWKAAPYIGFEFVHLPEKTRTSIFKYLFKMQEKR